MTKLPLVLVTWNDAWIDANDPVNLADVAASHKPKVIKTLGYVLLQNETGISLANEYYADEDVYRGRTFVFGPMIISVEPYKLTKQRRKREKTSPNPDASPRHTEQLAATGTDRQASS
jgi:hypothetical protein